MPLEGWMTTAQEVQHPGTSEESSVRQTTLTSEESSAQQTAFTSEENSARQTSFTKLLAVVEIKNEDGVVADRRDKGLTGTVISPAPSLATDLSRSQRNDDTGDEVKVAEVLPDVRSDQPTSILGVQGDSENVQSARFSRAKQEVPERVAELDSEEPNEDYGVFNVDDTDPGEPMESEESEGEDILYSNNDTAVSRS